MLAGDKCPKHFHCSANWLRSVKSASPPERALILPDQLTSRAIQTDNDFRALIDIAPVMIWVATPEGECTFLSRSWRDFTGQSEQDGLGSGWLSCIHADDWASVQGAFDQAKAECRPYQTEYRVRNQAGEFHWVLDSAAPVLGPSGALQGYIGSIVDNEARKTAELARLRVERRLQIAMEASGIGSWEWDLASNLFHFSDRALDIFGIEPTGSPISFEHVRRLIHPEDLPEVTRLSAAALDPAIRAREPYRYRISRELDGELRWIAAHGEALFDRGADGPPLVYIGTFEDITEEVVREQSLQDAAARLSLALDAAQLAVWELDITEDRLSPSPALNRLYGFPEDARPTSDEFRSRYAPGEQQRIEELGREARLRGENRIRAEVKHVMPDGSVKWLLIQAQEAEPLADGHARAIGVAMDITERRQSEEKLAVIAREMEHRVKNSLTLVQALVDQSFRAPRPAEEGKLVFSQRLAAYVRATELLTKSEQGAEMAALADVALAPFRGNENDQITTNGPSVQLEPGLAAAIVLGLHELATNAVKYGSLSVPEGSVEIVWSQDKGCFTLDWRERGGPPVAQPARTGFGSRLLGGALLQGKGGETSLSFAPDGVHFHLLCSLR